MIARSYHSIGQGSRHPLFNFLLSSGHYLFLTDAAISCYARRYGHIEHNTLLGHYPDSEAPPQAAADYCSRVANLSAAGGLSTLESWGVTSARRTRILWGTLETCPTLGKLHRQKYRPRKESLTGGAFSAAIGYNKIDG